RRAQLPLPRRAATRGELGKHDRFGHADHVSAALPRAAAVPRPPYYCRRAEPDGRRAAGALECPVTGAGAAAGPGAAAASVAAVGAGTGSPTVLEVRDLSVRFRPRGRDEVRAVSGLSYSVPAGRTVAIIGESGSGKTASSRAIM